MFLNDGWVVYTYAHESKLGKERDQECIRIITTRISYRIISLRFESLSSMLQNHLNVLLQHEEMSKTVWSQIPCISFGRTNVFFD